MAINKKLIHFKNFSDFNSKKLSANENNTQYTLGIEGTVTNGSPDILYQSICYIKDTKQQWTHGQLYDGTNLNEAGFLAGEETSDQLDDVETNTYVKYVPQTLTDEQKAQTRINIGAVSGDNFKTINGASILGSGDIEISGGGGEDIRYFTDFPVERVVERASSGSLIPCNNIDALIEAVRANKLICVPYANVDSGYVVATYSFTDGVESGLISSFNIFEGDTLYYFFINRIGDSYGVYGNHAAPLFPYVGEIDVEYGIATVDVLDNSVYLIGDVVETLYVYPEDVLNVGTTIKFISGENLTIEIPDCFWANGVVPTIEPNTHYELSISQNLEYGFNAVLAPFKAVE